MNNNETINAETSATEKKVCPDYGRSAENKGVFLTPETRPGRVVSDGHSCAMHAQGRPCPDMHVACTACGAFVPRGQTALPIDGGSVSQGRRTRLEEIQPYPDTLKPSEAFDVCTTRPNRVSVDGWQCGCLPCADITRACDGCEHYWKTGKPLPGKRGRKPRVVERTELTLADLSSFADQINRAILSGAESADQARLAVGTLKPVLRESIEALENVAALLREAERRLP